MKGRAFIFLAVFLVSPGLQAWAQEEGQSGTTVRVSADTCARLVEHVPAPDVEYRPGVDVHGRKVVPADLGPVVRIDPPTEFSFDLNYDLSGWITGAGGNVYEPHFKVGTVTVKDGVPYFEGHPLIDEDQIRLSEACQRILK